MACAARKLRVLSINFALLHSAVAVKAGHRCCGVFQVKGFPCQGCSVFKRHRLPLALLYWVAHRSTTVRYGKSLNRSIHEIPETILAVVALGACQARHIAGTEIRPLVLRV